MKKIILSLGLIISVLSCKNEVKEDHNSDQEVKKEMTFVIDEMKDAKLYAGKLNRIDSFPSEYITPRPVDVWLPKDYSEDKKYAVFYMHDGQMLFDSTTTWNKQEWKVDEWATQLMDSNKTRDFIVVGIHNIPDIRWQDLFPQKAFKNIDKETHNELKDIAGQQDFKLNGDNYLKFLVNEVRPYINKTYSVNTDSASTFVMGSSMGGLMSMYAISEYPVIFGGAACLSTHWVGARPMENNPYPDAIFKYMEANFPKSGKHKIYFDYGNKTLDAYYPKYAPQVDTILETKGYTDLDAKNMFFEGTDHSENAWNKRLDLPLTFLLGK